MNLRMGGVDEKEFGKESITKTGGLNYSISVDTGATLSGEQIPVSFEQTGNGEVIYKNGFTADHAAFSGDYQQADVLTKEYIDLPRIQQCCFEDKESVAQITAIHRVGQKYRKGDVSNTRSQKYQKNETSDTTYTDAEMLRSGLGMCSEFSSHTGGYLGGCGFSYELVAGKMNGEPHNINISKIDTVSVFIDWNNIGTDDLGIAYPPIYIREGNIGRHFLFPEVTINFS